MTNRDLPRTGKLRSGDLCRPGLDMPEELEFSDLGPVSVAAPAPVEGEGIWRVASHLLMGWNHLRDEESLRELLSLYYLSARHHDGASKKLDALRRAIEKVTVEPQRRVLGRPPAVMYGSHVTVDVHDSRFEDPGAIYLFGAVLSHFLSETATLNTFSQLTVRGLDKGIEFPFAPGWAWRCWYEPGIGTGRSPTALDLTVDPRDYDFFQLVCLLEARFATELGGKGPAKAENIRLRPSTSLAFPTSDVAAVRHLKNGRIQVEANFMGLYGVTSPLPRSYVEQIRWDEKEFPQIREFLDIIHHGILSLFYRTWRRHRYEQSFRFDAQDRISRLLLGLAALRPEDSAEQYGMEPGRALRYLGMLIQRTRPLAGLCTLLKEELPWTVAKVESCTPRWIPLPEEARVRLSRQGKAQLGKDILVGTRCLDRQGQMSITLGPVNRQQFLDLLPGGPGQARIRALVRLYARQPLDICLRVLVPRQELDDDRRYRLGSRRAAPPGPGRHRRQTGGPRWWTSISSSR